MNQGLIIKATVVMAWLVTAASDARAQFTYFVDDNATGPVHDGSTWCQAFICLQDALDVAQPNDTIRVAEGTYRPDCGSRTKGDRQATFQLPLGVQILGGHGGCEAPDPDVRDPNAWPSLLSGDLAGNDDPTGFPNGASYLDNSLHVVTASGTDATTHLDGFTISGGNANGAPENDAGAAIYSQNGSAVIRRCLFQGNSAARGGAVHCSGGALTLWDSMLLANAASSWGGALDNYSANTIVINCVMVGNTAGGEGGAIHSDLSDYTMTNSTLCNNVAGNRGGGVFNYVGVSAALTNTVIWGNVDLDGEVESAQIFNNPSNIVIVNHSCVTGWSGAFGGVNNTGADPEFVASPSPGPDGLWNGIDDDYGNLRIMPTSPCRDAGDNNADVDAVMPGHQPLPEWDLDGNPRIAGANVDMGAYELVDGAAIPTASSWGIVCCTLLFLAAGTVLHGRPGPAPLR
ncbi:MAG: choice-of-anchor Q domain-containing protein [Planctomycetota bacterium]|jgi:predicted outer membrane repeat protein